MNPSLVYAMQTTPLETVGGQQTPDTAMADTASAIAGIAESVGETGVLLAQGEWSAVWDRLITEGVSTLVGFIPNVLAALFVGFVFWLVYRALFRVSDRVMTKSRHVDAGLHNLGIKTFRVVGLGFILLLVLSQLGVDVTAIVAGLGITGLALGFAAKDTLENFISGVTILLDTPFRVGEVIKIEDVYGTVKEISLRSTWIETPSNTVLVMPNTLMINQKLINFSRHGVLRVDVDFGIAYKEDIDRAREVVMSTVRDEDRITSDPGAQVVVTELGDSSVNLQLRLFVNDSSLEYPLRFEYTEKVKKALDAADIEIPFPHLQLFIDEAKAWQEEPLRVASG